MTALRFIAATGNLGLFSATVFRATVSNPLPMSRALRESWRIGVRSLPILLIISVFVGTTLAVQGYNAVVPLGGQHLVGMFVGLAGVREMAPIMVAAMVAAKAGTEMASQLAVMRGSEQIEALEVMAVDPHWHLVTPRLLGIIVVLPPLTWISIFVLVASSALVASLQLGLNGGEFIALAVAATRPMDLVSCSIKAVVFGTIICLVCCWCGFRADPGASGVGSATNSAVVTASVVCAMTNYFLSEALF